MVNLKYHYILIPPRLQLNFFDGAFVNAGPSIGINIKADKFWGDPETTAPVKLPNTPLRIGVVLGAGWEIPASFFSAIPEVSYDFGIANVIDLRNADVIRLSHFQAGVSIVF